MTHSMIPLYFLCMHVYKITFWSYLLYCLLLQKTGAYLWNIHKLSPVLYIFKCIWNTCLEYRDFFEETIPRTHTTKIYSKRSDAYKIKWYKTFEYNCYSRLVNILRFSLTDRGLFSELYWTWNLITRRIITCYKIVWYELCMCYEL